MVRPTGMVSASLPVVEVTMSSTDTDARQALAAAIPRLRRFALALTGSWADADDLTQDTLERALTRLDLWKPDGAIESWAFRIMQNRWIDTVRARRARLKLVGPDEGQDAIGIDGRDAAAARLRLAETVRAFQELPPDQRAAAALVLVEGYSYREAAEILETPEGTVCSRLGRARAFLEQRLGAEALP